MREGRDRQSDAFPRQQLHRPQLVPRPTDRNAFVQRIDPLHFKLAQNGHTVKGDRGPDPRDHRIIAFQLFSVVIDLGATRGDVHVTPQRVDDVEPVTSGFCRLLQALVRVEIRVARKHGNFHSGILCLWRTRFHGRPTSRERNRYGRSTIPNWRSVHDLQVCIPSRLAENSSVPNLFFRTP